MAVLSFLRENAMKRKKMARILFLVGMAVLAVAAAWPSSQAQAARIKDIASISGIRDNPLLGYGMVSGLAGTGDTITNGFTRETLSNLLTRQGLTMKPDAAKAKNVAAVMVTANLPPFAKIGAKIDITVSSVGDAMSLQGGTLLLTALRGADGQVYAVAQGPIVLGGFSAGGQAGSVTKNHPSVGRIPNGASVEKELQYDFAQKKSLTVNLYRDDFTTARKLESVINATVKEAHAQQLDSCSVSVGIASPLTGGIMELISLIENLDLPVDAPAVVVMNEKTGTVVMGEGVRISTVAVAHGNLTIQVKETARVSQPLPFAPQPPAGAPPVKAKGGTTIAPGGQTVVTTETNVGAAEEKSQLVIVPQGATIQDLVKALNAIGVSPRDLITIMQTIKEAGALQASLKIM
jgi:flagellar P-ring protein precursor FlgI